MGQQDLPLLDLSDVLTPEEYLGSILIVERRLRASWINAADKAAQAEHLASLKCLIKTKQALISKIEATSSQSHQQTHNSCTA